MGWLDRIRRRVGYTVKCSSGIHIHTWTLDGAYEWLPFCGDTALILKRGDIVAMRQTKECVRPPERLDLEGRLKKDVTNLYATLRAVDQAMLRGGRPYSDPDIAVMLKKLRFFNMLLSSGSFFKDLRT